MLTAVLHAGDNATCAPPMRLSAVIEPFTTLSKCVSDNEFWDYQQQECLACSTADQGSVCTEGEHVRGCDALMYKDASLKCETCANSINTATEKWLVGAVCTTACLTSHFHDGSSCTACSAALAVGYCDPGQHPYTCNGVQDVHCGDCPAIDKSVFSKHERFVDVEGMDCQTACRDDAYREDVSDTAVGFFCKPCTALAVLIARYALQSPGSFFRFMACGYDRDTKASECPFRPHSVATGHAPAANASCLYRCELGAHRVHFNASDRHNDANASEVLCTQCDDLHDHNGSLVPRDMYTVTSFECAFECHAPYHAHNGSCWRCESDRCDVGKYLYNCSVCLNCTSAGPHATFTGSGVWDAASCSAVCDPGFWNSFKGCQAHTAYALLAASCPADTYIRNGTSAVDTACMPCKRCEGMNQTRNCSLAHNGECARCAQHALVLDAFVGTRCAQRCASGRMQFGGGACEECAHACPPGQHFTADRASCHDCRNCSNTLPADHVWALGCASRSTRSAESSQTAAVAPTARLPHCNHTQYLVQHSNGATCASCDGFPDETRPSAAPTRPPTWAWTDIGPPCVWQCMPGLTRFEGAWPGILRCALTAEDAAAANAAATAVDAPPAVDTVSAAKTVLAHVDVLESFGASNVYTFFAAIAIGVVFVSCCF